jgi:hypothetical protein
MPATYTLISSNVLTSSAASVTFSSIPATYTDLVLRTSIRNNDTSSGYVYFQFNSDSATNYSNTRLQGTGSAGSSARQSSVTYTAYYQCDTSGDTANTFATGELYIPSYTASQDKPIAYFSASETNATASIMASVAGLWRNSAAVNSITIANLSTLQFVSGSSFYLYGISNA